MRLRSRWFTGGPDALTVNARNAVNESERILILAANRPETAQKCSDAVPVGLAVASFRPEAATNRTRRPCGAALGQPKPPRGPLFIWPERPAGQSLTSAVASSASR